MQASEKRSKFRAILGGQRCVTPGSVWDPISARIADRLGVEVGLMGGSLGSYAVLGAPDVIVITLTEFADQARRACRVSQVALLADAGMFQFLHGAHDVQRVAIAVIGVAGLTIEDTLLPRAFGAGAKPQLIPVDEGVAKMKAALAARRDPALVIVGRTSAASITGMDDAIARLSAYAAAGVDALMVLGVKNRMEMDKLSSAVGLPFVIGGAGAELADRDYLASRRVRVWSAGHPAFAASVKAIHDAMKAGQDGGKFPDLADKSLMDWVTRADEFTMNDRRFLGG
jgi:oxaloacetate decarboxylase